MAPHPHLALIILAVRDVALSARFYDVAFAWPRVVDEAVYVEYRMPDGRRLGLYAEQGFARNTKRAPTLAAPPGVSPAELYFHAGDVEAAVARVKAAGARVLDEMAPRPWGDEAAYFADPDGHVIVVARPLAASR